MAVIGHAGLRSASSEVKAKKRSRWISMSISLSVVYMVVCTVNGIASTSKRLETSERMEIAAGDPITVSKTLLPHVDPSIADLQVIVNGIISPTAVDTASTREGHSVARTISATSTVMFHGVPTAMSSRHLTSSDSTVVVTLTSDVDSTMMTTTASGVVSSVDYAFASFRTGLMAGRETEAPISAVGMSISQSSALKSLPEMVTKIRQMDDLRRQQKSLNVSKDGSLTVLSRATTSSSMTEPFNRVTILIAIAITSALFVLAAFAVIVYRRHKNRRCGKVYLSNNCGNTDQSSAGRSSYSSRTSRGFCAEDGTGVGRPVLLPDEIEAVETSRSRSIRVRRAVVLETDFTSAALSVTVRQT